LRRSGLSNLSAIESALASTRIPFALAAILLITGSRGQNAPAKPRPRIRDVGITVGILPSGPLNAITDVEGVKVGQTTLVRGDTIRTGVTAILPHSGNLFRERVPAAIFVGNGFGKLAGSTQVNELGEIETPIVLTSTLSVPRVADAVIDYMLALPGNEDVVSVNPVVGETNDAYLNDIRARAISHDDVIAAIKNAQSGPVEEGAVGAGTGTIAFGFKGGIGTASRRLPASLGGYTVGVLVQSNFGGILTIAGAPVGRELGRYYLKEELARAGDKPSSQNSGASGGAQQVSKLPSPGGDLAAHQDSAAGSAMIVIATDAPLDHRNLARMAARAMLGLAYTGSSSHNHSGDYVIAFSTAPEVRIRMASSSDHLSPYAPREQKVLSNDGVSPLFLAVAEATQEAVYNSMFRATTTSGQGHTVEALPIDQTVDILRRHGLLGAVKSNH
jgi:D-aminopeptidase